MTDESPTTDGGTPAPAERDVRRAGERPPDVPTRTTVEDLLPRLLDDVDGIGTGFHIRARLAGDDPAHAAEQLVQALERKVSVVGTTLDAGVDPGDPQLDVLIECDHTMSQVATALARVAPVEGAVVLDVTDECRHVLDDQEEAEAADAADANDVFNELQEQVSQADYDQVVDELEGVSFPGGPDPDEEVDLEEATGVELDDDEDIATAGDDDSGLDPDRETIDLDNSEEGMDPAEVSAEELFGEADSDTTPEETTATDEADETAIEQAVQDIESSVGGDEPVADVDDETADTATAGAGLDEETTEETSSEDLADASALADAPTEEVQAPARPSEPPAAADEAETEQAEEPETPGEDVAEPGEADAGPTEDVAEPTDAAAEPDEDVPDPAEEPAEPASPDDAPAAAAGDGGANPAARTDGAAAHPAGAADVEATVDELVRALESGEVGPDRRQRLREALGIESTHSIDVRLEYLQKRVDNLAAYNDAWEAFLSEEGTGDKFIDEVQNRLDDLEAQVEAGGGDADGDLHERVESLEATVDQLDAEARLAAVEDRLDDLADRQDDLADRHDEDVSQLRSRVDDFEDSVDERLDSLTSAVEKLKQSLQQVAEWRESVNRVLRGK